MSTIHLPLLVEAEQLEPLLNQPGLLVVDLCNIDTYAEGHIPGAVNLGYANIIRVAPPAMGLLPDEVRLSAVISGLGLTPETHVVAYDDEGGGRASRFLWTLDALGHAHFSLLNGGLQAWIAGGHTLSQQAEQPIARPYPAHLGDRVVANKAYILSRLGQPDLVLLDTRTPGEYQGLDVRAARGGHIPGAVNMNWILAMDQTRQLRFKSEDQLRSLLENLGVTPDKEIIVYCQTHHRSAHTYLVLKVLGYPKVRGYPGAWSEWGNDGSLPVER
ncbi:MAG: sulfurtransferase [Gammaproteobacteria bacterium]|nr:sulfurtransferase [Gammaproteobacteria bacterium]MCP5424407.1 sulfurtransferase [Gammaproteobacteria bacterium]MCP5458401.1 sulfurtransferase [Gammaproteobacteria bacterium]